MKKAEPMALPDIRPGDRKEKKPSRLLISAYNWLRAVVGAFHRVVLSLLPASMRHNRNASNILWVITATILLALTGFASSVLIWVYQHSECYSREAAVVWKEGAAHTMERTCPAVGYPTEQSTKTTSTTLKPPNICVTTLTDSQAAGGAWQRLVRCRNFDDVAVLTWPNHVAYARKHRYTIMDNSRLLDHSRPPAWSKILAVQDMFQHRHNRRRCEWVLWLDADTVIMNSSIKLESLIPADDNIHLIITTDRRFTANSGVWLIRNSEWSQQFLFDWWNSKGFVRAKGLSLSGDNDAFGYLVRERLGLSDNPTVQEAAAAASGDSPIRMPARCNMNSFAVVVPAEDDALNVTNAEWYLSDQWYHAGDFIAHASGIDQKAVGVQLLLKHAT
jgi:galactosyl transferase GMA12/MNN10 family